jgi:hypothetical protein
VKQAVGASTATTACSPLILETAFRADNTFTAAFQNWNERGEWHLRALRADATLHPQEKGDGGRNASYIGIVFNAYIQRNPLPSFLVRGQYEHT